MREEKTEKRKRGERQGKEKFMKEEVSWTVTVRTV